MTSLYQEQQKTYFILIAVFILVAVFLLSFVFFPQFYGSQALGQAQKIFLLIVTVLDLVLFWSFSSLNIKLTEAELIVAFGIFRKKIKWEWIKEAKIDDYSKANYLGYGIRLGRDKSLGFVARSGRGIRLKLKLRDFFFTTDNPEELLKLIKSKI
ncbi:MAG: hypothetical protein COU22_01830 [Candidatus Komeilibacteria bacterium CG10_big_fil_rev_8_21_14_0_10_41_13]|uniref:Bacterial Pleckstrin homology domain-containing protein n=1 Tax=Candidatus Komeilibacteria bacterium CG10_big_fil_rev_8_21_14_0_10_41_13 TaxID=1974476 RepID=A0A2M6WCI6_9BACT|nr:MAG: hypothetical protein COU22_01830 [Candidatus Komeilibacteria bacterium CG10_big_fil_rev_8_21_14_0_10_41_13]